VRKCYEDKNRCIHLSISSIFPDGKLRHAPGNTCSTLSVAIGGALSLLTGFERHTPARLVTKLPRDSSHHLIGKISSSKKVSHYKKLNVLHLSVTHGFVSQDINLIVNHDMDWIGIDNPARGLELAYTVEDDW
jgi:hypothetical protein